MLTDTHNDAAQFHAEAQSGAGSFTFYRCTRCGVHCSAMNECTLTPAQARTLAKWLFRSADIIESGTARKRDGCPLCDPARNDRY